MNKKKDKKVIKETQEKTYEQRIRELELQGLTTSDAQAVADAEEMSNHPIKD